MQRLFPEGIGTIVKAKVTEQPAAVQRIISLLRGELAPQAEICGVPAVVVNRIAQLSDLLAKELENIKDEGVSYQDVRAAQLDAHEAHAPGRRAGRDRHRPVDESDPGDDQQEQREA